MKISEVHNIIKNSEVSPMMKQFVYFKGKYPDYLLLLRCGDFYETYNMDAKECATILGITMTWRNNIFPHNHESYDGAIAGFPHYTLDTYLPKLIRAGKKVAICNQLQDLRLTNNLVKRYTPELVTPCK